jgi:hypothetical protein
LVLQSTAVPALTVLYLILIANKDTRCRAALWIRRTLGMDPGTPTARLHPSYARITALEVIFVNWFMYLINITLNDSRVFGIGHPMQYVTLVAFVVWTAWIVTWRLTTIRDMPLAVRYAIGVAGPAWSAVEIASRMRLYTEIWIYPLTYPVAMLAVTATFVLAAIVILRSPASPRGASA